MAVEEFKGALDDAAEVVPFTGALDSEKSTIRRFVADPALSLAKGVIGVPEGAVGIADLATGGRVGKAAEEYGFRPKDAKAMLDEYFSPQQKAANKEVADVDGFIATLGASLRNPSTIAHSAIESVPSMLGGGAVARGVMRAVPGVGPLVAGALGEGTVSAGQTAEQIRQETPDGLLRPDQSALAAGSGALTGLIGMGGGAVARRLGIGDIDTMIASGTTKVAKPGPLTKVVEKGGMPARFGAGALSEGVFEELPQSAQEQIAQNLALGKPWDEGVGKAAAQGMLAGGLMGGGAAAVSRPKPPDDPMAAAREALRDTLPAAPAAAPAAPATAPAAPQAAPAATAETVDKVAERVTENIKARAAGEPAPQPIAPQQTTEGVTNGNATSAVPAADEAGPGAQQAAAEAPGAEAVPAVGQGAVEGSGTREDPVKVRTSADVEAAAQVARDDYTPPQGEANNVQRGHVEWDGLDGTIEVAEGGTRKGTNPETGEMWQTKHTRPYGYWKGTKGADGMHVDVIWGPELEREHPVYVVDENDESGKFRQHKTLPGFPSKDAARAAYLGISSKKPENIRGIVELPREEFKRWLKSGDTQRPIGEWVREQNRADLSRGVEELKRRQAEEAARDSTERTAKAKAAPTGSELDARPQAGERWVKVAENAWRNVDNDERYQRSMTDEQVGRAFNMPISTKAGVPTKRQQLFVQRGRERFEVASFEEASKKWGEFFNSAVRHGAGGSGGSIGDATIVNQDGKQVARISQNGRVWPPGEWQEGQKPLYDPHGAALSHPTNEYEMPQAPVVEPPAQAPKLLPPEKRRRAQARDATASIAQTKKAEAERAKVYEDDGAAAFAAGKKRLVPRELTSNEAMTAWYRGWDRANVAEPVPGVSRAAHHIAEGPDMAAVEHWYEKELTAAGRVKATIAAGLHKSKESTLKSAAAWRYIPEGDRAALAAIRGTEKDPIVAEVKERAASAPAPSFGSKNTIFTADAAEKARQLLRKKLGQVNANAPLDPEIIQAGITLAGFHIEAGARSFAEYSAKMIGDLGDAVKPFLKAWYLAVRNYPGFDNKGMQSEAELDAAENAPANDYDNPLQHRVGDEAQAELDRRLKKPTPESVAKGLGKLRSSAPDPAWEAINQAVKSFNVQDYEGAALLINRVAKGYESEWGDAGRRLAGDLLDLATGKQAPKTEEPKSEEKPASEASTAKDDKGNRIWKNGERVELIAGQYKGRRGKIDEAHGMTMTPIHLGVGVGKREHYYTYTVKTDNGATVHASASDLGEEPATFINTPSDIQIDGEMTPPEQVWRSYGYAKQSAKNQREKQARARKPEQKREWLREAEASDVKAAKMLEAFNAWARTYPEDAKAIRGDDRAVGKATPQTIAAMPTQSAEGLPAMTLHADRKHGKTGETIHVVTLNGHEPPDVFAKMKNRAAEHGGYYSSYRGRGALPGFTFRDLDKAKAFMGAGASGAAPKRVAPTGGGPHFAAGYTAATEGKDRQLPSYFTNPSGENAKAWLGGWDAAKREEASQPAGSLSADPDPVEQSSSAPSRPPSDRWTADRGTMPGEPMLFLDVAEDADLDTAKAAITEREIEGKGVLYDVTDSNGKLLGTGRTVEEAAALAEKAIPGTVETAPAEEDTGEEAKTDERPSAENEGSGPLEEVAPEGARPPERDGAVGGSDARGGGEGAAGDRGPDAAGLPAPRSGGGGAQEPRPASPRAGRGTGRLGARRARRPGSGVSETPAGEVAPQAPNVPGINYRITDEVHLGQGGEVQKFRDNLAAIRTLKDIERDGRRATPEEQRALARYVGWGGLANAFADDKGEFKADWKDRGAELADLLSSAEIKAARRSTRNAHYTSETIVNGIWDAVVRMGYKGGLVLESSMGTGNFVGLMPEDVLGSSKVIGVEYDSLTARIAQALYPQSTVLHTGFQKLPLPDGEFDLNVGNPPFGSESLRFQYKPALNGFSIHNQFFLAGMDALKPGGIQAMVVSRYLMDAVDKSAREAMASKANLLGAIRLPDTAFKENARTDVVTDILFFQKLSPSEAEVMAQAVEASNQQPRKDRQDERKRRNLAEQVPAWVNTTKVADPLGGEEMTVNSYFADNPHMILGRLERSGKMRTDADVNVKLEKGADLAGLLDEAIAHLPEGVLEQQPDAIERSKERYKSMADALKIAISGQESGSVSFEDGKLQQVMDRETPAGDYELTKRELTPRSPWSQQLLMDAEGRWYRLEAKLDETGNKVKEGKRNVYERKYFPSEADIPGGLRLGESKFERLKALVEIRDLLKKQLVLESEDGKTADMESNRKALAKAYRAFTDKHGLINIPSNAGLVSEMPDGALLLALELNYRPEISQARAKRMGERARAASATPAPVLKERVVVPYAPPGKADSPSDALAITLAESGRVDVARIAGLLGVEEEKALEQLTAGTEPLVFKDPETETWETRDAYLSGPVKRKLAAARAAGLARNAEALEKVQPEPWGADKVTAIMGSTWIPEKIYADFLGHITGQRADVAFSRATNSYMVRAEEPRGAKMDEWGTPDAGPVWLITHIMNSQAIRITYTDQDGKTHLKPDETALAQLKAKQIEAEFADWVFQDSDRRNELVAIFNDKFNIRVNRQFNGQHLKLPGKVPDEIIRMRRHQMNTIWRGISQRFMLVDHVVGAGKTYTAIARAMERRRMGLSKKPTVVVPNHLVEEWAAQTYRLYPGAKVLAAGKKDFEKARRRKLFAKIATGDWDLVIMPHSSFGFIDIAPETEERFLEEELRIANEAIEEAIEAAAEMGLDTGRRKPYNVKEAERLAETIQGRLDGLKGRKDRLLTFEQMGIDDLTVDEAHEYKNLFYSSRLTGVRGMNDKTGSKKAFDLYNKIRVLRESPTGTVTFMTGTPISNSAVEMYQMMRYLAAQDLKDLGLEHFDAWRAQFVDTSTKWEPTESGRLKEVNRLGRSWSNMRSLMDVYYSFTDAVSNEDIQKWYAEDNNGAQFPIPKVKGGERQSVVVPATAAQKEALETILAGFDNLPHIGNPIERNAERLRLMDRARKVSLDIRALDRHSTSKEEGGKLEKVTDQLVRVYRKWDKDKGTQIVFLDRSVPKAKGDDKIIKAYDKLIGQRDKALADGDEGAYRLANDELEKFDTNEIAELRMAQSGGWNAYEQLKKNLVAKGIPSDEIRFVQEAHNDQQKQALFDAVNAGEVRIIIGSTPRMGAGTNVQKRLVALHHVDVTWKPSDIEQREGRIIRQGNNLLDKYGIKDFEVEIIAYATERTVDAKLWDVNSTKLKTINGIRKYGGEFTMDFEDEDAIGMAEIAALASGDPMLLERVKVAGEVDKLQMLERAHERKIWGVKDELQRHEKALAENPRLIEEQKKTAAAVAEHIKPYEEAAKTRSVKVEGQDYTSHFDAAKAVKDAIAAQQKGDEKAKWSLNIAGERVTSKDVADEAIANALGDDSLFEAEVGGKVTHRRLVAARALAAEANALLEEVPGKEPGSESGEVGTLFGYKATLTAGKSWGGGIYAELNVEDESGKTIATGRARDDSKSAQFSPQYLRSVVDSASISLLQARNFQADYLERQIKAAEENLPRLRERANDQFPQAAELAEKQKRLEEIIRELAGKEKAKQAETEVEKPGDDERPEPKFSRKGGKGAGLGVAKVKNLIEPLVKEWASRPDIVVLPSIEQAPAAVREANEGMKQKGAKETPEAVFYQGKVYVLADAVSSPWAAYRAVFHEVLGHYGLRKAFGNDLVTVLHDVVESMPDRVKVKALEYGLDWANEDHRLEAAEEVLAEIAQKRPQAGLVKRAIAAIRRALRQLGITLDLSENDIIVNFILPAREFVERGGKDDAVTQNDDDARFARRRDVRGFGFRMSPDKYRDNLRGMAEDAEQIAAEAEAKGDTKRAEMWRKKAAEHRAELNDDRDAATFGQPKFSRSTAGANWTTEEAERNGFTLKAYRGVSRASPFNETGTVWASTNRDVAEAYARETWGYDDADVLELRVKPDGIQRYDIRKLTPEQVIELGGNNDDVAPQAVGIYANADDTTLGSSVRHTTIHAPAENVFVLGRGVLGDDKPLFSRVDAVQARVADELDNLLTSQRTFNRWWHRTVGTQFHKAKQDRHFKRVFDLGQDYLTDTSRYAMLAEKEAPNLLLRLEGAGDIFKRGISGADKTAIAAPIFNGTLEEKRWSEAELKERFGLTDKQVGLYNEFRASVDKSLDELAKSTIAKMANAVGVKMPTSLEFRDLPLNRFHDEIRSLMRERSKLLTQLAKDAADGPGKGLAEARAAEAKNQATAVTKLFNRIEQLKKEGYAPLMRFGEYTVYVTQEGEGGEREQVFFGLYETQRAANAAAKALAEEYPEAQVQQGILSKEAWKVFQGISPDTLEIFGKAVGLDENPFFQDYLRLAVNNRSALKRLIHRKGTPGFSEDVTRVLASFVTSNARMTSSNYHLGEMQAAVEAIPKAKGDVRDEAVNLWKYLADPVEEASGLRGFLFAQYLGGSIASAMVNATQPITMTAPYLAKYADAATVGKELARATVEAAKNKSGADIKQAYERAVDEGLVAPHEIYQLMAQARGNLMGATGLGKAMKVWGSFFSLAEAFNRRSTFIAAYRIAVAKEISNPYAFAKRAVHETQGLYNKGNRPNWARGATGATIFTFKQFSIAYVEFLKRLHDTNPKAFWLALAILMLAAGAEGLPFAEDAEDIIDTIGQWMGYSTNSKRWLKDRAAEALGEGGSAFVLHGISAIPGFPLDVSARMGLHNLIPATSLLKKSESAQGMVREATEILGPIGGVVSSAVKAVDTGKIAPMLPKAIADALKGSEMWEKGYATDQRGYRTVDTTKGDAILKLAGFQPSSIAEKSRNIGVEKQDIDLHRSTESGIADKWARGIVDGRGELVEEAREDLARWNRTNETMPIRIDAQQIRKRVLDMRRSRDERFVRSAPREIRNQVAGRLRE